MASQPIKNALPRAKGICYTDDLKPHTPLLDHAGDRPPSLVLWTKVNSWNPRARASSRSSLVVEALANVMERNEK